ncbi:MAG: diguanylate cyclase [Nitrospinae bacterium]|nr:diguanylate cyclase [Nitrospinota bacterium]
MFMKKVIVVEDNKTLCMLLEKRITTSTNCEVVIAQSMAEAIKVLDQDSDFFISILDLNLPDSENGEIIDEFVNRGIPAVVFTGTLDDKIRNMIWSKRVVDYVIKTDPDVMNYITSLINRIKRNKDIKVLVVDDTKLFRSLMKKLLEVRQYQVLEAENGERALKILKNNPDIKLIITDYVMPVMDGFELITKVRKEYPKEDLAIIGISAQGMNAMSARFLKSGADDFIIKQSFITEEFYSRVKNCIENLENIHRVKEAAIKDFLTGLYNRRYFFDAGKKFIASAIRENKNISCAMLDIDFFKKVNDNYGHDVGDIVLKAVAELLRTSFRETDIVARMGGEEFCVLSVNINKEDSLTQVRQNIR